MRYKWTTRTVLIVILTVICLPTFSQELKNESKFQFASEQDALTEFTSPAPTISPTNREISERSQAIASRIQRLKNSRNTIVRMNSEYERYLIAFGGARNSRGSITLTPAAYSCLPDLQWQVSITETSFSGEPILFKASLKNVSSNVVKSGELPVLSGFLLSSISLNRVKETHIPVKMTKEGIWNLYNGWATRGSPVYTVEINPDESIDLLVIGDFDLTKYYDLSEPGEYELTFYTRRFIDENGNPAEDQELEYPRKTTVQFTILPKGEGEESSGE